LNVLQPVLHAMLMLLLPPLLLGVVQKTKAAFAGRVGPPVLQVWYDLIKLMQKGSVFSTTTTWVFRAGPVVALAATLFAALLVPAGAHAAFVAFPGDLVLFAYLLGLARFFTICAALDTGSSFEGMGGAREATFACFAEPALFFAFLVLARISRSLSLDSMLGATLPALWSRYSAPLVLVVVTLFILLLAENCRIPFDDPNTHLELTMIHEVMVLDHSGPALGMILYGAALKLYLFAALLARLLFPPGAGDWLDWLRFLGALTLVAVLVGTVESIMARLRLVQVPRLLVAACLLSAFGIVLLAR
jgi:formate hydrogenlyase subunit 4